MTARAYSARGLPILTMHNVHKKEQRNRCGSEVVFVVHLVHGLIERIRKNGTTLIPGCRRPGVARVAAGIEHTVHIVYNTCGSKIFCGGNDAPTAHQTCTGKRQE